MKTWPPTLSSRVDGLLLSSLTPSGQPAAAEEEAVANAGLENRKFTAGGENVTVNAISVPNIGLKSILNIGLIVIFHYV